MSRIPRHCKSRGAWLGIRLVRDGTEEGHPGRLFLVGGLGALREL